MDADFSTTTRRTDLRTIFPHESWRDVYALLDCETSIEPPGGATMTAVCGALGCERTDTLALVETPYGPRVLCETHRQEVATGRVER